jgi:hypothetical protein
MTRPQARPSTVALGYLTAELRSSGVTLLPSDIVSFDAVHVVGPKGRLFVSTRSVRENGEENHVEFLAAPEPDDPNGPYAPLGTSQQITHVAGIIRQRVGVSA